MTRQNLVLLAALGSLALLLGAFAFQHLGGLAPCKMCLWQRYPHLVAILAGLMSYVSKSIWLPLVGSCAALVTASIGLFHSGVEQGWWEGPTTCSSGPIGGMSADQLLDQILNAPLVRCDEIPWEMLGLSMAGWNALISFGLFGLWIIALRR